MPVLALAAVLSVLAGQQQGGRPAVQLVGAYDNIRTTEEHIYGYELELWRVEGRLRGFWSVNEGLAGDGITVDITNLLMDQRRRTISFTARICSTLESFEGRLANDGVRGTITLSGPKGVFDKESVLLKPSDKAGFDVIPIAPAEWNTWTAGRLKRRGPDCGPLVIGK